MNIEELTIKQAKAIAAIFGGNSASNLVSRYVGQYVIVRSRNEGINAGHVVAADETGIVLKGARRIWYHRPADNGTAWYEGVAESGLGAGSKLSVAVAEKAIIEDYSITVCSDEAAQSIQEWQSHGQN